MTRRTVVSIVAIAVAIMTVGGLVLRERQSRPDHDDPFDSNSVVMLGDSITEQVDWSSLLGPSVVNRGFSGYTTAQLVPVARNLATAQPRMVFVLTGTNDIRDDHPPSWTVRHLDAILTALATRSPTTRVVVQSVLPRADVPAAVDAVNAAIMHLADERDVEFLDLHASFDDGAGGLRRADTTDGIHLTSAAYARWAELVRRTAEQSATFDG
ncbi:MAG: GDSL-type esterase/lipase family protein [Ilumatobacteraceae bacterium]|nr:GDSL-type esterase/lipase family protein [Ilumatobacteraceae bacterium]